MATVIYARKSTESEDRQVQSLDDQVNALTELAKREGIHVIDVIRESRSAKTPYSRPEFQNMIARIETGEIDGVLTWAVNRLNRNLVDGGIIAYLLQTGKLRYIRTPERVYRPEDNVLILSIENGMATNFIQDLSRNVKRGMQGKADRGWMPGPAPLGYINNLITHEIDPDPDRFDHVQRAWNLLLTGGYTVAEIHRELVRLGLKGLGPNGRTRPISRSILYRVFTNPFYAGLFRFRNNLLPGRHHPMISTEDFEAAQIIMRQVPGRNFQRHEHTYSGLLRCGNCGCRIVAETKTKRYLKTSRVAQYTYYHCSGAKGCTKRGITEAELTSAFLQEFDKFKFPQSFDQWAQSALDHVALSDQKAVSLSTDQIEEDLRTLNHRITRLTEMRINGELTTTEYVGLKSDAEKKVESLKTKEIAIADESSRIDRYIRKMFDLVQRIGDFENLSISLKRALVLGIGPNHYLTLGNPQICLNPVLQKIASFEPLRNGSEIPKTGHFASSSSCWLGFIDELRTLARKELYSQDWLRSD